MGVNGHLEDFVTSLCVACKNISKEYFDFSIYSEGEKESKTIYRERVYCYELYHQLRIELDKLDNKLLDRYMLHGEVDKINHPLSRKNVKPDFIFHVPGEMNNLVVMEVKHTSNQRIRDDIKKLKEFMYNMKYRLGIFLVYGKDESVVDDLKQGMNRKNKIMLLWHKKPDCEPRRYYDPL